MGGWLGSVVHLVRFAESLDGHRPPAVLNSFTFAAMVAQTDRSIWVSANTWYGFGIMGQTFPSVTVWTHSGGSQGSRSTFVRFSNGFSYGLLLNGEGRYGNDGFRSALAETLSGECLRTVRSWPSEDLFPRYLPPHASAVVDAMTFQAGAMAPASLQTLFGSELAGSGSELALVLRDSAGVERPVAVLYASLTQVNFQVPADAAAGNATLLVRRAPHADVSFPVEIVPAGRAPR